MSGLVASPSLLEVMALKDNPRVHEASPGGAPQAQRVEGLGAEDVAYSPTQVASQGAALAPTQLISPAAAAALAGALAAPRDVDAGELVEGQAGGSRSPMAPV